MSKYYIGVGVDRDQINNYTYNGKERRLHRNQKEIGLEGVSSSPKGSLDWEHDMYNSVFDTLKGTDWGAVDYIIVEKYLM